MKSKKFKKKKREKSGFEQFQSQNLKEKNNN